MRVKLQLYRYNVKSRKRDSEADAAIMLQPDINEAYRVVVSHFSLKLFDLCSQLLRPGISGIVVSHHCNVVTLKRSLLEAYLTYSSLVPVKVSAAVRDVRHYIAIHIRVPLFKSEVRCTFLVVSINFFCQPDNLNIELLTLAPIIVGEGEYGREYWQ